MSAMLFCDPYVTKISPEYGKITLKASKINALRVFSFARVYSVKSAFLESVVELTTHYHV